MILQNIFVFLVDPQNAGKSTAVKNVFYSLNNDLQNIDIGTGLDFHTEKNNCLSNESLTVLNFPVNTYIDNDIANQTLINSYCTPILIMFQSFAGDID